MVLWPAVTVVGFLLLTALVVLLGMHSTARYEQERRVAAPPQRTAPQRTSRHAPAESVAVL